MIESRKILKENFGEIKFTAFDEEETYKNKIDSGREPYVLAVEAADGVNSKYWGLMMPLAESFRSLYQTYLTELNLYLRESEINA